MKRELIVGAGLVLLLLFGCGADHGPLEVGDAMTAAGAGGDAAELEAGQAGAGGADASLVGFGRDAGSDDQPDAGGDAAVVVVDAGPTSDAAAAVDGCVPNDCGGCAELACAAEWQGVCQLGKPCPACPADCYESPLPGVTAMFWCDGTDALVCSTCFCGG